MELIKQSQCMCFVLIDFLSNVNLPKFPLHPFYAYHETKKDAQKDREALSINFTAELALEHY